MFDVIILGKGPAGIQASLYIKRAGLNVLVLAKDGGALMKTESIANYYGTGTLSGPELLNAGIQQAPTLGSKSVTPKLHRSQWSLMANLRSTH